MTISTDLVAALEADATVGPLVSNGGTPETFRIYPLRAPQEAAAPFIVWQVVDGQRESSFAGDSGLPHPMYRITAWAATRLDAEALAEAVRAALDAEGGLSPSRFHAVHEAERDVDDEPQRLHGRSADYVLWP